MKKASLKFPVAHPVPVDVVLGRLGELAVSEKWYPPTAEVYVAEAGIMLRFRASFRILGADDLKELQKLEDLVDGHLIVGPRQEDGKDPETNIPFRMLDATITVGPVTVLPHETAGNIVVDLGKEMNRRIDQKLGDLGGRER